MLCHASFASILQGAAGRAWMRTRLVTARACRRLSTTTQQVVHSPNPPDDDEHKNRDIRTVESEFNVASGSELPQSICLPLHLGPIEVSPLSIREAFYGGSHDTFIEDDQSTSTRHIRTNVTIESSASPEYLDSPRLPTFVDITGLDSGAKTFSAPQVKPHAPKSNKSLSADASSKPTGKARMHDEHLTENNQRRKRRSDRRLHATREREARAVPHDLPEPTNAATLYTNLIDLSVSKALPGYSFDKIRELVNYHQSYPEHQSARSFNFLASLAIAKRHFDVASSLMKEMGHRGINGNSETRKLAVRFAIFQGRWTAALVREIGRGPLTWPIWLEFCQTSEVEEQSVTRITRQGAQMIELSRNKLLMRYRPSVDPGTIAEVPSRVMFYQTRWLLRNGHSDEAFTTTMSYFRSLPAQMDDVMRRHCTDIINLHLRVVKAQSGKLKVTKLQPFLRLLLSFNKGLRPDPTTLFLVLSSLRYSPTSCRTLVQILQHFEVKWGKHMVNDRILLWLTRLSLKAGYGEIARYLVEKRKRREEDMKVPHYGRRDARQPHKMVFHEKEKREDSWLDYEEQLQILEEESTGIHVERMKARKNKL